MAKGRNQHGNPYRRVSFLGTIEKVLPRGKFRQLARELAQEENDGSEVSLMIARASELIGKRSQALPDWVDSGTQFLVVLDIPEQATLRLATALRLRKPDRRLQVSRDEGVVKRLVIALSRTAPWEGILDAYLLGESLVVVLGDMSAREFPVRLIPKVSRMEPAAVCRFEIDSSGSFLHWPESDLHLGPSQLLQAVDPMYLADIEIERYEMEKISLVIRDMRKEYVLKQTEIEGLSDRHVRRLENEEIRLTVDAAEKLARSFGMTLSEFLDGLSQRVTELQSGSPVEDTEVQGSAVA